MYRVGYSNKEENGIIIDKEIYVTDNYYKAFKQAMILAINQCEKYLLNPCLILVEESQIIHAFYKSNTIVNKIKYPLLQDVVNFETILIFRIEETSK